MSETIKIQIDLSAEYAPGFYELLEKSGTKQPQNLFEESIACLRRCVDEVAQGRKIASIPTENGRIIASLDENNVIVNVLYTQETLEAIAAKYAT